MTAQTEPGGVIAPESIEYRLLRREDLDSLMAWGESPDLRLSHYTFALFGREEIEHWYRAKQKFLTRKLYGLVAGGRVIGFVTLKQMNFVTRTAELGIAVDPALLSQGYGEMLLTAHLQHVYAHFPVDSVYLKVATFNKRAIRSYTKAGFFREGDPVWEPYESQAFRWNIAKEDPRHFRIVDGVLFSRFWRMKHVRGTIRRKAPAKINLALDVIGRLPTGYHELEMILQSLTLADDVALRRRRDGIWTLAVDPSPAEPGGEPVPVDERNLALRAAHSMARRFGLETGGDISIVKRIPVSAGLAGGSTDAAAVIHAIDQAFGLGLTLGQKCELGLELGADLPFCLTGGTAAAGGVGEKLREVRRAAPMHYVVVTPDQRISTGEVFEAFDAARLASGDRPDVGALARALESEKMLTDPDRARDLAKNMKNVLESVTMCKIPEVCSIACTLEELGAIRAMMSGSGPSVFAWFCDRSRARQAYGHLQRQYKNCFLCEAE